MIRSWYELLLLKLKSLFTKNVVTDSDTYYLLVCWSEIISGLSSDRSPIAIRNVKNFTIKNEHPFVFISNYNRINFQARNGTKNEFGIYMTENLTLMQYYKISKDEYELFARK
jgi:hypothetical protein